jgi:hypothetical protein
VKILFIIITLVIFPVSNATAQTWFEGSITLADKQVLTGDISIDTRYDLILIKNNGVVDVYPAHRVYAARVYDANKKINRRYISMKHPFNARLSLLFEIVISGEIFVLRRELTRYSTTIEHEALGFDYYVLYENELIELESFNPRVYPKLKPSEDALASFIKNNRLNPNDEAAAVQIIQYYNKQVASAEVVRK